MKTSILYTLGNEVYANITNHCDCNCTFPQRNHKAIARLVIGYVLHQTQRETGWLEMPGGESLV